MNIESRKVIVLIASAMFVVGPACTRAPEPASAPVVQGPAAQPITEIPLATPQPSEAGDTFEQGVFKLRERLRTEIEGSLKSEPGFKQIDRFEILAVTAESDTLLKIEYDLAYTEAGGSQTVRGVASLQKQPEQRQPAGEGSWKLAGVSIQSSVTQIDDALVIGASTKTKQTQ